jgi:hypothetical protein
MNLVFLYPSFYFKGEPFSLPTGLSGFSAKSVITGSRQLYFKKETASTTVSFKTDVRTLSASERQAQYLYIAGLNLVTSNDDVDIDVIGADDSAFSVNAVTESASAVNSSDLVGRKNEDYILELDGNFKDYWQVLLTSSSMQFELRKIMLGQWFYFGVEPDAPASLMVDIENYRRHVRVLELRWKGVSNEVLEDFTTKILQHQQYNPVVLYARDWSGVLNGETVFHCQIESFEIERIVHNSNQIAIRFKEIL